jgi:hypothetical protein
MFLRADPAQAFRHCFWNALMTRRIGRGQAAEVQMHLGPMAMQHGLHQMCTCDAWPHALDGLNTSFGSCYCDCTYQASHTAFVHMQVANNHENSNPGPTAERSMGEWSHWCDE